MHVVISSTEQPRQAVLCQWVILNGIDPQSVGFPVVVDTTRRTIHYMEHAGGDGQRSVVTPMTEDLPLPIVALAVSRNDREVWLLEKGRPARVEVVV